MDVEGEEEDRCDAQPFSSEDGVLGTGAGGGVVPMEGGYCKASLSVVDTASIGREAWGI
jgi:hypothetical protein